MTKVDNQQVSIQPSVEYPASLRFPYAPLFNTKYRYNLTYLVHDQKKKI